MALSLIGFRVFWRSCWCLSGADALGWVRLPCLGRQARRHLRTVEYTSRRVRSIRIPSISYSTITKICLVTISR
uniref:Putative secreted protein n=1 Tax=Anopheles darlingi TaxID=43151 RepID=A0A2M4DAQ0_ANODA